MTRDDYLGFRVRPGGTQPDTPDEVHTRQRAVVDAPGLGGSVRIRVGDITVGDGPTAEVGYTVEIEVLRKDGSGLIEKRRWHEAECLHFEYEGVRYRLDVLKLEYHVTNDDYVTIRVRPDPAGDGSDPKK